MGISICKCDSLKKEHESLRLKAAFDAAKYENTRLKQDKKIAAKSCQDFDTFTKLAREQHLKCPWHLNYFFFSKVTVVPLSVRYIDEEIYEHQMKQLSSSEVDEQQREEIEGQ